MSSEKHIDLNGQLSISMAPLCLDKVAHTDIENPFYCRTKQEFFPWIMLEYPEEVSQTKQILILRE